MKAPAIFFVAAACVALSLVAHAQSPAEAQTSPPAASASIPPDSPKYGVYPIAYREIITQWLGERLADPASAKLEFGEPVAGEVKQKGAKASGYRVEFKVNSRNKFGVYTGFQKYQVLIRNGEIIWADRVRS